MTTAVQAARFELLVLRARLPIGINVPPEPIHLTSEKRDASLAGAAEYLAGQAKPVRCRGRLSVGKLAISAATPTAEERQFHEWLLTVPRSAPWREIQGTSPNGLLRVKDGNDSINVTIEAANAWWRDYIHSGPVSFAGPSPSAEEHAAESTWEIGIVRVGPPVESYALNPDETVLCERCQQSSAVAVFRDRTATPLTTSLLCEHCLHAEGARELARNAGVSSKMSDDEARHFFDEFLEAMRRDMPPRGGEGGTGS